VVASVEVAPLAAAGHLVDGERENAMKALIHLRRVHRHITTGSWHIKRALQDDHSRIISDAVAAAERGTSAEIVVVIEAALDWRAVAKGLSPRHRALEVFSRERVWDTTHNNGILLYLLLADRDAEVVADRGFNDKVSSEEWSGVCASLEHEAAASDLTGGLVKAIDKIGQISRRAFPSSDSANELPDQPRVL